LRRIVFKVGSSVLTETTGIAKVRMLNLVSLIAECKERYEVILVSSGAVAAGYTALKLDRNQHISKKVLASAGQPILLDTYRRKFNRYNMICSQVLLEASIFKDNKRLNHAKDTINALLPNNVVPIINENDVTVIDELVFGDNDQLAAYVTHYFNASMLVILTDIDGYYDDNPHTNKNAKLKQTVNHISKKELEAIHSANSAFATGGIVTKLKAANFLLKHNKTMFLTSGFNLEYINEYLLNKQQIGGTLFVNTNKKKG